VEITDAQIIACVKKIAMKKNDIDFTDLTFLIPFRQDSIDRLENICLITEYLLETFDTNIEVLECAPYCNGVLKKVLNKKVKCSFLEDNDPVFFRTKYINNLVRGSKTHFLSIWDVDVIAPVEQMVKAVELLRSGKAHFVYPYEKKFLDTSFILRKLYIQTRSIEFLEQNQKKMKEMFPPNPVGGGFLVNTQAYIEAGIENEDFYGWGLEDGERYYRWKNMGYNVERIPGPMFHLTHQRGLNSNFHNRNQVFIKKREILKVRRNSNTDVVLDENDIITF
jgi:predicted glycosyltransferase involved in capsule biosynthesis